MDFGDFIGGNDFGMLTDLVGGISGSDTGGGGGGGFDWGGLLKTGGGLLQSGVDTAAGMWGLNQSNQMETMLKNAYSFNDSRPGYVTQLNDFMKDPSKAVTSSPGYKFKMDQALQGTSRQMAAQGLMGSGTAAQALTDTGSKVAADEYNTLFQQLTSLAGVNFDPSSYFSSMAQVNQSKQNSAGAASGGGGDMLGTLVNVGLSLFGL